jgi:hypothetical protein
MTDLWRVHPGGLIHFKNAALYENARHRVLHSRRLRDYLDIIMGDGYADDAEHLRWVAKGKTAEIESWANQIRNDSEVRS